MLLSGGLRTAYIDIDKSRYIEAKALWNERVPRQQNKGIHTYIKRSFGVIIWQTQQRQEGRGAVMA